ncbi:unnamed protein product, partial [Coregonus sp. 'balchen']
SSSLGCLAYVNTLTDAGQSAPYMAAQHGHLDVVQLLLETDADPNKPADRISMSCPLYAGKQTDTHTRSSSPLFQLSPQGHSDIVRVLVGGCDLDVFDKDYVVTPLLFAAAKGHQQCVQILIDAGTQLYGHEGCVEALLKHGADPNLPCNTGFPQLPIHAAAENGHSRDSARLLIAAGAAFTEQIWFYILACCESEEML